MRNKTQRLSLLMYILKAIGWTVLFLFLTEAFVRLFIVSSPSLTGKSEGGVVEIYGLEGYGIIYYRANMEIATPYTGGENIVVLGDSFTQARHIPFWKNYSSIAERELRSSGYKIDVRNFGYMASAIPYYIGLGPGIMATYHPTLVVIQVTYDDCIGTRIFNKTAPFFFNRSSDGNITLKHSDTSELFVKSDSRKNRGFSFLTFSSSSILNLIAIQKGQDPTNTPTGQTALPENIPGLLKQEFSKLRSVYGNTQIVFIIRPEFNKSTSRFYIENQKILSKNIEKYPEWHIMYLDTPFNTALQQGVMPTGFGNTKPLSGHWNINGQKIVGEYLAEKISEILNTQ